MPNLCLHLNKFKVGMYMVFANGGNSSTIFNSNSEGL
jgi:hypothetical protein